MASLNDLQKNSTDSVQLLTIINNNVPTKFHSDIKEAVKYMKKKHKGQKRLSGEAFYYHPLNVAAIVALMGLDTNSIITALLHNTPDREDPTKDITTYLEITDLFGEEVAKMVQDLNLFSLGTRSESDKEMITYYLLRTSSDLRPILIKLADRLHNARSINSLPPKKQQKMAKNLRDIYSPLAEYLNQYLIKKELEEIAFKVLMPTEYAQISKEMKDFTTSAHLYEKSIITFLEKESLKSVGSKPTIYGRIKGQYSTYKKMKEKDRTLIEIHDLLAFSVIFPDVDSCYKFMKHILKSVDVELEYYDDYIARPKENGYRSLQVPAMVPEIFNRHFELQIKTEKMHEYNIYGPASHLSYKYSKSKTQSNKFYWVKDVHQNLYEYQSKSKNEKSYPIVSDVFSNKIFVFTPQNSLIELPIGSTAVDFAYKVHSKLGHKAIGVKINGVEKDLSLMLNNGDTVEIITDESKELPDREWLQFVRTRRARDEIENEYKRHLLGKDVEFTHVL